MSLLKLSLTLFFPLQTQDDIVSCMHSTLTIDNCMKVFCIFSIWSDRKFEEDGDSLEPYRARDSGIKKFKDKVRLGSIET